MKKQSKTDSAAASGTLPGTSWTMSKLPGVQAEKTRKPVTLVFQDTTTRFGGYAGCNSYGGTYSIDGQNIKMDKVLATMMACTVGMKTERALIDALEQADHYSISGDKLVLKQGEKVLAEFVRSKKAEK